MKTCKTPNNGTPCGKASFANSSHECEEHFAQRFPATYARIKKQEDAASQEAQRYEAENIQNRKAFDP